MDTGQADHRECQYPVVSQGDGTGQASGKNMMAQRTVVFLLVFCELKPNRSVSIYPVLHSVDIYTINYQYLNLIKNKFKGSTTEPGPIKHKAKYQNVMISI